MATNLNLAKFGVQKLDIKDGAAKPSVRELDAKEMAEIDGGGFGPFGFGFRVFMKPAFIVWEAQQC